jgi:hypothetical protein
MNTPVNRRLFGLFAASIGAAALMLSVASPSSVSAATATTTKPAAKNAQREGQGPGQGGPRRGGLGGGMTLDAAAKALGMTTDALTKELVAGKSIADVAAAKKVSVDTVVNAIQAAMRPQIVEFVNTKGLAGPGFGPGRRDGDGPDGQGAPGAGSQGATGEALKTCLKGKGIDPTKVPTDEAGKDARAKALKECIKAGASS